MLSYSENLLSYATYSLIFSTFSNLIIKDCELRKSNVGVILYCNSTLEYIGNNIFEFYGIRYVDEKTTDISWVDITTDVYTDRSSIINYIAGNSICTLLPLSNQTSENDGKRTTLDNINFKLEKNFNIGICQFGSIFNHTHTNLIIDDSSTNIFWQYISGFLNDLRTFKNDTCIGMMNPQYACNLFELNDSTKSMGYAYINPNNAYTPIGQYIQKYKLNGYNYNISETARAEGKNIIGKQIPLSSENGVSLPLSTFYTDDSNVYNNGNFWITNLYNNPITYDVPTLWNLENTAEILSSLTSINAENLSLVGLLSYYFSSQTKCFQYNISSQITYANENNAMPIGLWARPHKYTSNNEETFSEKTNFSTFLCSDRYNYYIRNTKNINSLTYDKRGGNKTKKSSEIKKDYLANYGSTIFYFNNQYVTNIKKDDNLTDAYKYALVGRYNNRNKVRYEFNTLA